MSNQEEPLKTLDDIAMFTVTLNPHNLKGLADIQTALNSWYAEGDWPDIAQKEVQRASQAIEDVVLEDTDDVDASMELIGESIDRLQKITECIENGCDLPVFDAESAAKDTESTQEEAIPSSEEPEGPSDEANDAEAEEEAAGSAKMVAELIEQDSGLIGDFITESHDHLQAAEGALLEIETNPEDDELINAVFRAFHTIKGTSGFVGITDIQTLAHQGETLLDQARNGELKLTGGYADLALETADTLKHMIDSLQGALGGDRFAVPENVPDLLDRLSDPEAAGISADADDEPITPPRVGDMLVAEGKAERDEVEVADRDKGKGKIGETVVKMGASSAPDVAKTLRKQKQASASSETSIRVSTERLDNLINMVGELVITQTMVAQSTSKSANEDEDLTKNVAQLGKITRELQGLSMSMRMVPVKGTFQKMARLVRDIARKSGKKVNFVTEGEDTEIDRNMVESINDPLVHMVRNSVDHGIEAPEDRVAKGKPEKGTVTLRAYHAAGSVVIELEDDGKGLDRNRIYAKAVENGVIEDGKSLTDSEVHKLIFSAGLSTAKEVTDVSGRGVGMDVVKRNIEKMRGSVDIASEKGKGSVFSVRVPLTLAIIDGMVLRVGREKYILPTTSIRQAIQPSAGDVSTVVGKGEMVDIRGELIPMFRLNDLFDVEADNTRPEDALLVVAEANEDCCAIMIDELLDQQQVVIKSLGKSLGELPGVAGGAILGDGRVGLILDVAGILSVAHQTEQSTPDESVSEGVPGEETADDEAEFAGQEA